METIDRSRYRGGISPEAQFGRFPRVAKFPCQADFKSAVCVEQKSIDAGRPNDSMFDFAGDRALAKAD
jgi:hypothetical protein